MESKTASSLLLLNYMHQVCCTPFIKQQILVHFLVNFSQAVFFRNGQGMTFA